jgi:uncharacterized membrane protein
VTEIYIQPLLRYQVVIYRFYYVFWAAQLACVLTDYVSYVQTHSKSDKLQLDISTTVVYRNISFWLIGLYIILRLACVLTDYVSYVHGERSCDTNEI